MAVIIRIIIVVGMMGESKFRFLVWFSRFFVGWVGMGWCGGCGDGEEEVRK